MLNTTVVCDRCQTTVEAQVGKAHPTMFLSWTHPIYGGGGRNFCLDCAEEVLADLQPRG